MVMFLRSTTRLVARAQAAGQSTASISPPARDQLVASVAILGVAAVWGATYVVVKETVARVPVADFLALRFAVATVVLLSFRPRALRVLGLRGWLVGGTAGVALGAGYGLQTAGLVTTPASVSGFITGLLVVLTPLAAAALLHERVTVGTWLAVGVAVAGLGLLSLNGPSLSPGALLTLGAAFAFALHIVALSRWAPRFDVFGLVTVQVLIIAVASALIAAPGGISAPGDTAGWLSVIATGVVATSAAYALQTWAQVRISATRTGVILTAEPVFAGAVAVLVAGEAFGARAALGSLLVLTAMLMVVTRRQPAGRVVGGTKRPRLPFRAQTRRR